MSAPPARLPEPRRRPRWRTALAAILLLVAIVLAPVAVVSGWAKATVMSTNGFVETFGPLADRPEIQQQVTSRVTTAIEGQLSQTRLPDAVVSTLSSALEEPVARFVASDAFRTLWDDSLHSLHAQLADETQQGSASSGVTVDDKGQIAIQLGPIVTAVRSDLVQRGVPLASRIPDIDHSAVVATVSDLPRIHSAYRLADTTGTWTPPAAVACLLLGVLVANRRRPALIVTGLAVAIGMGLTWVALGLGREVAVHELSGHLTADSVHIVWDETVDSLRETVVIVGVVALGIALVAALSGLLRRRPAEA